MVWCVHMHLEGLGQYQQRHTNTKNPTATCRMYESTVFLLASSMFRPQNIYTRVT